MPDDISYIYKPNVEALPVATPNIDEILFRCYEEQLPVERAVEECRRFGAKEVGPEQVEKAYQQFSKQAEKLNESFAGHFKEKGGNGGS